MASHIGVETEIKTKDKEDPSKLFTWRLSRWDRGIMRRWLEWAADMLPDPLKKVRGVLLELACEEQDLAADLEKARKAKDTVAEDKAARLMIANRKVQDNITTKAVNDVSSHIGMNNPKVIGLLQSIEGASHLLELLLQKYHPGTTYAQAEEIIFEAGMEAIQERLDRASGVAASAKNEEPPTATQESGREKTPGGELTTA
jgi:hypothetical protein